MENLLRTRAVLGRIGAVEMVEVDTEGGEVRRVLGTDARNQFFRRNALGLGPQHDRGAVGIVRTDVVALVAGHLLVAHPDVGLGVFHQVA